MVDSAGKANSYQRLLKVLIAVFPFALLAGRFYWICFVPLKASDKIWLDSAFGIMLMEFLLVHSGAFIATSPVGKRSPLRGTLMVLGIYLLFVVPFALKTQNWLAVAFFIWTCASRIMHIRSSAARSWEDEYRARKEAKTSATISGMALLLLAVLATIVGPLFWIHGRAVPVPATLAASLDAEPSPIMVVPWAAMYFTVVLIREGYLALRERDS